MHNSPPFGTLPWISGLHDCIMYSGTRTSLILGDWSLTLMIALKTYALFRNSIRLWIFIIVTFCVCLAGDESSLQKPCFADCLCSENRVADGGTFIAVHIFGTAFGVRLVLDCVWFTYYNFYT